MPHASNIVRPDGPDSPHAFDNVPLATRNGTLDARCPVCRGYGQWNVELDLVSFRCKRAICGRCDGAGWVETGDDPLSVPDIVLGTDGHPRWVVRQVAAEEDAAAASDPAAASRPAGDRPDA